MGCLKDKREVETEDANFEDEFFVCNTDKQGLMAGHSWFGLDIFATLLVKPRMKALPTRECQANAGAEFR